MINRDGSRGVALEARGEGREMGTIAVKIDSEPNLIISGIISER